MAEDITDVYIATEAGDAGWQSLSALAAAQVEAELPISSTDATVVLDSPSANTLSISTGGTGRVESQPRFPLRVLNQDGSFFDATGQTTAGITSVHNVTGTSITRCSAFDGTLNFSGTTSDLPVYNARNVNFLDGASVTGVYCGFKVDNLSNEGAVVAGYYSEVDGSAGDVRYQFYGKGNAPSYFGGDVQTSRIVGAEAPDTDASIELGANATISTGGKTGLQVGSYQTVGVGTAASRSTLLHAKGTPNRDQSTGVLSDLYTTVSSDDAFGYFQQFTVNDAATVIGEFKAYVAKGIYGAGTVTNYTGYQCETVATGADNVTAFRSRVNVSSNAGTNYAFYSEGSAVSHFNGALEVPKIVGSAAPDTDASITLGTELLTTNHTPTQPNSIATKQTVDDKIWVGTTAEYQAISPKNPTTLYCITD